MGCYINDIYLVPPEPHVTLVVKELPARCSPWLVYQKCAVCCRSHLSSHKSEDKTSAETAAEWRKEAEIWGGKRSLVKFSVAHYNRNITEKLNY